MATRAVTTESQFKEWVLVANKNENVILQTLNRNVWLCTSPELPVKTKEDEGIFVLNTEEKLVHYSNSYDNLYAFISSEDELNADISNSVSDKDFQSKQSMNSIIGETIVGEKTDYVNVMFQYNVSDYETNTITNGTDFEITHNNAKAILNTGNGIGYTKLESKDPVRYSTGHEINTEFTHIFAIPEINTNQKMGLGDDTSGYAGFGYKDLDFGIWLLTVDDGILHIPQTQWNLNTCEDLNPEKFNIYKITFGWYGGLPIDFSIFYKDSWVKVHRFSKLNESINPHLGNPSQKMMALIERTSGTGNIMSMSCSSWRGGIVGKPPMGSLSTRQFITRRTITAFGTNIPIISIRSKEQFQGKDNHVRVKYGTVSLVNDGNKAVDILVYRGGTLTGGTWNDFDTENSVSEYNITSTSYDPGVGNEPFGLTFLNKVDTARINLFNDDAVIPIFPGEEVHLIVDGTNTGEFKAGVRILEEF